MGDLIGNINKLHTTELGTVRIKKNLSIEVDNVVQWCKTKILDEHVVHHSPQIRTLNPGLLWEKWDESIIEYIWRQNEKSSIPRQFRPGHTGPSGHHPPRIRDF